MAKIESVNITSMVHSENWSGDQGRTGIDKKPVMGEVELRDNCVVGDLVVDSKRHGGYDKAVYAYAIEDAQWWSQELGRDISNGNFGENLTTSGIDVNQALIGQRWQIGSAVLEISEPRIPCRVFAGFWQHVSLIKDFTNARRPGAYLRIVQDGAITAGDTINILDKPSHSITILDIFEAKFGNRDKLEEIKKLDQLSGEYRDWLTRL